MFVDDAEAFIGGMLSEKVQPSGPPIGWAGHIRQLYVEVVEVEPTHQLETVMVVLVERDADEVFVLHHKVTKGKSGG
jgi:hypothetical protein